MELRTWVSKFVLILTYPRRFMLYLPSLLSPQSREHGFLVLFSFALLFFAHTSIWITIGIHAFTYPVLFSSYRFWRDQFRHAYYLFTFRSISPFLLACTRGPDERHLWYPILILLSTGWYVLSHFLGFFSCLDASPDASRLIISGEQGIAYLDMVTWDGKLLM
jgi:hypothetical protein